MKNFFRAVRKATRYRLMIVLAFICSVLVGALWAGNITALYPIVEIVFRGDSLHDWAENRVQADEQRCADLASELQRLETAGQNTDENAEADSEIRLVRTNLASSQSALEKSRTWQSYIVYYFPGDPFRDLLIVVVIVVVGTILKSIFLVCNMLLVARISAETSYDLQDELFEKTLRQDLAMFSEDGASDILSRCTHYMRVLEGGLRVIFGKAVREPIKMAACLIGAALISWQLLLLCMVVAPIGFVIMRLLTRAMKQSTGDGLRVVSEIYLRLWESFSCIKAVKAFTAEEFEHARFLKTGREYIRRKMRMALFRSLFRPTTEILGIIIVSLAILAGAWLVLNQSSQLFGLSMGARPLSPGALLVFFGMLAGVAEPVRKMSEIYASIISASAAADRIYKLIDREPKVRDPAQPEAIGRPHQELDFQQVSFQYRENEPVLREIDLRIPFGETVVFLGPNGCGKSTLLNLVPRFYDPKDGVIFIDGVCSKHISLRDLRGRIGLVTQETLLFADTIVNNIRYGLPEASDEQVIAAAKQAHAHEFIEKLEAGYETFIGQDGGQLSGGQRQRISLARAILRDPEILILDEATSQIDVESERLIHQTLKQFVRGRTSLIVSHRLSTLTLADRIVLMDHGKIVAEGSHEQLYEDCEPYRQLYEGSVGKKAA